MKKYFPIYPILLVFILIFPPDGFSQKYAVDERWRWTHFTTEYGLPSNSILSITETPDGTPWANTRSGLAWYNGYYWEKIDSMRGLHAEPMFFIAEGDNDSLIVIDRMFRPYSGGKRGFRPIRFSVSGKDAVVSSAAKYPGGRFLLVSSNVLFISDGRKTEKFELTSELRDQKIFGVWNTGENSIWINASAGLYRRENNRWILILPSKINPYTILHLKENSQGYGLAFIASPPGEQGLWEWNSASMPKKNTSEGFENILALDVNGKNGRIILKETDLIKINRGSLWSELSQINPEVRNILTLKFRRNGDIWVGTVNGLYLFTGNSEKWTALKYPSPDDRNKINEMIFARDGSLWAATHGGVVRYKPDGSVICFNKIEDQSIMAVTGLTEDNQGSIWISSGQSFEGAYKWDGTRWSHYGLKDGLDAGNIHKIEKDRSGKLWFLGLYRKDFHTRKVEKEPGVYVLGNHTFSPWSSRHGLPKGRYYALTEGPDGAIWFGSSAGLIRWKPDNQKGDGGTLKHWTAENGELLDNKVFTLATDRTGILWFGDRWAGLGRVENDRVKYLTTADGLVSSDVWKIAIDSSGSLLIGTQGGLSIYRNGVFSSFKHDEGLENTKIWPILPLDSKIYLGTNGAGIQILDLAELDLTPVKITALPPMIEKRDAFIRWTTYSYWGTRLTENIETRSNVDGGEWSGWSRQHGLRLDNLSAGGHTVSVQSKNILGYTDSAETVIKFKIPAPFYSQPEFFIPVGVLSAALLILTYVFIAKKRRADAALRRSEQRYRNLFDNANDAIMIIDPEKKIILGANSKACEIYGYTKEELISMPFSAFTKTNGGIKDENLWTLKKTGPKYFETIHNTKSGNRLNMHINAALIEYEGKQAILTQHRDISDVREAEAKIRLLAQTITSAKDYISITALDNTILFVNDAFAEGHGYAAQELIGVDFSVVISPLTPKEKIEQISAAGIQGSWNGEIFHRRKDGTDFQAEVWSAIVQGEENQPVAVVHVARDVTERKKSETERENLILELQSALLEVKTLSGLLPICSSCKKIRDDHGYWIQVETYISKHSEATFTHGLCPECLKQYYPEVYKRWKAKEDNK